jgi:hypothetical protein
LLLADTGPGRINPGPFADSRSRRQQMLVTLNQIAQNINSLSKAVTRLTLQQETADQRAFSVLAQIAHRR